VSAGKRRELIILIDEAIAHGARQFRACQVIKLCERRLRRWRDAVADGRTGGYRGGDQELSESEKDAVIEAVSVEDLKDLPLRQAHIKLLDRGICIGSYSSFRRVLEERNMPQIKQHKKRNGRKRPVLEATAPNQIWCWDITWLESRTKGKYFYLYMIIDMYSRKVVGWDVAARENGPLAKALFARTLEAEGISEHQLVIHSDNGKPMRSRTLRAMFNLLKVTASYSRPHTSNDNAFAESLFATLKGRVAFPEYFRTLEAAREFSAMFFQWYNEEHLHSGLDYVTPSCVHAGAHHELFARRNALLEAHRQRHPKRHAGRRKVYGIPDVVRLKHRVPQQEPPVSTTKTRKPKVAVPSGRMGSYGPGTAGEGCRQEPSGHPGLSTLDDRPHGQYIPGSSTSANEN